MAEPRTEKQRGVWWRPGAARKKVSGVLEILPDGWARVELDGVLVDEGRNEGAPILLGTTTTGRPITLEDVRFGGGSRHYSSRPRRQTRTQTISAEIAYLGAHLPARTHREVREAWIELTHLLPWSGVSGFDEDLMPDFGGITVSMTTPDSPSVKLPAGRLTLSHGWQTSGDLRRARTLEKTAMFQIKARTPMDVPTLLRRVASPLRYLLTFATDRQNEVEQLTVMSTRYRGPRPTHVVVEYARVGELGTASDEIGDDFLFDAHSLGDRYADVLERWFALYERVRPALDLLFGRRYRPGTFADNHFLNVAAAAETFHRTMIRNEVMPKAEHRVRKRAVIASAPPEHQEWLKDRLANSNEPTLRERLVELHGRAFQIVAGVLGPADQFAGPVVVARNALTHRGGPGPTVPIDGRELLRLTEQTAFLLTSCLLLDLGFSEIDAMKATRGTRRFRLLSEVFGRG